MGFHRYGTSGESFDDVEDPIREHYEERKQSQYPWDDVRDAARDSYNRTAELGRTQGGRSGNLGEVRDDEDIDTSRSQH